MGFSPWGSGTCSFAYWMDGLLSHLEVSRCGQVADLIRWYPCLFGDIPTQTHLLEHDIDLGECKPIRQRFYWVHLEKLEYLDAEVNYMLDNGTVS